MKKKLYRTIIQFEVLSEDPIDSNNISLADIVYETMDGDWSGNIQFQKENEAVTGKDAVKLVLDHGTDPEFFGMDNDGNEIDL